MVVIYLWFKGKREENVLTLIYSSLLKWNMFTGLSSTAVRQFVSGISKK
jgi:hypothetical protein